MKYNYHDSLYARLIEEIGRYKKRLTIFFFFWRCLINCEKIASVSTRISVATTCTGQACNTAKYQWQLFTVNSNGDELSETPLTRDMTETDLDLPGIIIKKNQLAPLGQNWFYRLEVSVSQDDGPSGNAAYQFRMNDAPRHGNCTVTPTNGEALKTEFVFICTNWEARMINYSLVIGLPCNLIPSFTFVLRD